MLPVFQTSALVFPGTAESPPNPWSPVQDSNLDYRIQSGDPRIRSSDKSLSNREFATSAVGKNDAIVGGCRGQRGQKR